MTASGPRGKGKEKREIAGSENTSQKAKEFKETGNVKQKQNTGTTVRPFGRPRVLTKGNKRREREKNKGGAGNDRSSPRYSAFSPK